MARILIVDDSPSQLMGIRRIVEKLGHDALTAEDGAAVRALMTELLEREQVCSRQAGLNSTLAFGLLDQGQELLDLLYSAAVPKQADTYGAKGGMQVNKPRAALISGRL